MPDLSILSVHATPLERLVDDYLMACRAKGLAPTTVEMSYGYPLRSILLPWCAERGITAVEDLDARSVDAFSVFLLQRASARGKPLSRFTVHAYVRSMRSFLTWCTREGEEVKARPKLPQLPRRILDVLTREQITSLEEAVPSERDKVIIRILGDCGLRASELCTLRLDDLMRRDRQAYLRVHGKGSRERLVPVPPALFRRIERYARAGRGKDVDIDMLFVSLRRGRTGGYEALTRSGVLRIIRFAGQRAGLKQEIHTHLLRHSFITNALRGGMNPVIVAQIVGHSSMRMIEQVYSHLNASDAYDAMVRLLTTA